jgi:serine/threonine protein kinase
VSRRTRIPDALYKKITLSTTLPKSIKALAKRYQTLVQSGGTIEGGCWTHESSLVSTDLCTLPSIKVLGEGANGIVFNYSKEPEYVWKQSNALSDIDEYIKQLQEIFSALNVDPDNPIYISLFKAHPHKDRSSTLSVNRAVLQGFAYKMKKFNPFKETNNLIDNIKALCEAVKIHHSFELVHFDAKVDNVLVDEKGNCTLVDVDGSLSFFKIKEITEVSFLQTRSKFHAITPLFAHPLILAIFHGTDELLQKNSTVFWDEIGWLLNICMVHMRNSEILEIINHKEFHEKVFPTQEILSLKGKPLLNLLKYADYYSLLLSYYMYVVMKMKRHIENLTNMIAKNIAVSNLEKIKICFIDALKSKARACDLIDPPAAKGGHCKRTKRPLNTQSLAANNAQTMESPVKYQRTIQPVGANNAQTMKSHVKHWNITTLNALQQIPTPSESDIEYLTIGLDGNIYVKPDTSCEDEKVSEDGEFPYIKESLKWTE